MDRKSKLNKIKVCQLTAVDFSVSKFLLPLIDGMNKKGWDVDIICSNGKYSKELENQGYKFKFVKIERSYNIFKLIRSTYNVYKIFVKHRYDVVHVHSPIASIIGRIASKLARVPLIVYTAHGFYFHEEMNKIKYLFYFIIEKLLSYLTDLIFTQSNEDYNTAKKYKFMVKNRLFCIGNGVNINKFNPKINDKILLSYKRKMKIPESHFVVGIICRLVREKGLVEFLNAAKNIKKKYPKVTFLVIGERLPSDYDKNVNKELEEAKIKLNESLKLLGERNDIRELLGVMDLFCLLSWREGMPRTIIEAMMMSKPVIGTNIRGSRELIIHKNRANYTVKNEK